MLEPWALRHKPWKKRFAWWLYQRRDLQRAQCLIATSDGEARSLRYLGFVVPIATVPNGVDVPEQLPAVRGAEPAPVRRDWRTRTALFLGRIYPIKGLPMLIEAWARVRPAGWRLCIVGPDEAGHQKQVEAAVASAGLGNVVSFVGPVHPTLKRDSFLAADLFVLPSYSESFGMAVAEALSYGVPVLTTTGAPWSIVKERGCGWWVEPTVDGIVDGLRQATALDSATLRDMGLIGRALVSKEFSWKGVADVMLSTYQDVLLRTNHQRQPRTTYSA